jgi:hypothetical protein
MTVGEVQGALVERFENVWHALHTNIFNSLVSPSLHVQNALQILYTARKFCYFLYLSHREKLIALATFKDIYRQD